MISLMHRFYQEIDKAMKAHENPDILPQTELLWRFTIIAMALEGNADHIGMISRVTDKALKAHENPEILPQTALLWTSTNPSDGTERDRRHVGMILHMYWLYQETDKALKAHEMRISYRKRLCCGQESRALDDVVSAPV